MKTLIRSLILGILILGNLSSCSMPDDGKASRTATALWFMECLKNEDLQGINKILSYDVGNISKTDDQIIFDMRNIAPILKEYGIPKEQQFIYDEFPKSADKIFYINIPIDIDHLSDSNHIISATFKLGFARRLGDEKIVFYMIDTKYQMSVM